MSVKNLACAISQGGHNVSYNDRVRRYNRKVRKEEKRFIAAMLEDEDSDATISVESPLSMYQDRDSTGKTSVLKRFLASQIGHDWEEVYHRLCRLNRRTVKGAHVIEQAMRIIENATDHTSFVSNDDIVVDENGVLCLGSDFKSVRNMPRPYNSWSIKKSRKVVDHCGDLFWKMDDKLVLFTSEQTDAFHQLQGNNQRALKGYHRSLNGKRRKNRLLPWQKRYDERQIALGRTS